MLKLPSKFLQQHGSKIRDGLIVLKLVSPDPDPDPDPNPNPNPMPNPDPGQVCEQGVEEACDALTREEDARAKWLALRAEAKRRRALGLPATTRGIWGF